MSGEFWKYKEVLTVIDAFDYGACLQGVIEWVLKHGRIIKKHTDQITDYPGRDYAAKASRADSENRSRGQPNPWLRELHAIDVLYGLQSRICQGDGYGHGRGQISHLRGIGDGGSRFMVVDDDCWLSRGGSRAYGYSFRDLAYDLNYDPDCVIEYDEDHYKIEV